MTEPEELEEDLFADLYVDYLGLAKFWDYKKTVQFTDHTSIRYDGDDGVAKLEASQAEPTFQPALEQAPDPAPSGASEVSKKEPDHTDTAIKDEHMYGNGQNGDIGLTWNGGPINDGAGQYNGHMDEERRGIGIKEDG